MKTKKFSEEALRTLNAAAVDAAKEAKELFPQHPKAQQVWVKLCSVDGGIEPVVKTLGLQMEYKEYLKDFNCSYDKGMIETAASQVDGFVAFCKEQVLENFYMFK